jgi:hypothetical protein
MKPIYLTIAFVTLMAGCANPFAPGLESGDGSSGSILGNQQTVDGVFRNFQYAYTFKDTLIYGQLLDPVFAFVYRDYDQGVDVSWGRDDEMRTTYGLFLNTQNLDLVWNNILSQSGDSLRVDVTRNFSLTITFNASDIVRVNGYAALTLSRPNTDSNWKIIRWRDESNF